MTVTCPTGHQSATTDYCDQCGALIAVFEDAEAVEPEPSTATQRRAPKPPPGEPCPTCGTPRLPSDRYCEVDGFDFESPATAQTSWYALVTADRGFFDRNAAADLAFPDDAPERAFTLDGDVIAIGRRSPRHDTVPDIDLGEPPADPGASRQHARLQRTDDGRYALVDCGSANGTFLNDDDTPLPVDVPVPLADGDRIHLGAWTTIVIEHRRATGSGASA